VKRLALGAVVAAFWIWTGSAGATTWVVHVAPMGSLTFSPATLTIAVGDTVTWTWDSSGHTSTSDDGVSWDSGVLGAGQTYSHTFTAAGVYPYHCTPHRSLGMTGEIRVGTPIVTTGAADGVGTSSATLHGTVAPNGSSTTYWFEYGTSTAYGGETPHAALSSSDVLATIAGLSPATLYHFRLVATNSGGRTDGADAVLSTAAAPPPPAPPPPQPSPPPPPRPPKCVVPNVRGKLLRTAKRAIVKAHCSVGRVRYARSKRKRGRVLAQSPRPGRRLARGAKVSLVVSRGLH
jgi:plastocyanin